MRLLAEKLRQYLLLISVFHYYSVGIEFFFNYAIMEIRRDSLWSWLVCAAACLSMVIVCGGSYNFGLLLPPLMDHFNSTRQETGNLFLFGRHVC